MDPLFNIIHQRRDGKSSCTYYPVVVVGAGESGICMGCRLRQGLDFDQFRIFERKSSLGGTWYTSTYPGIACDIPALLYSFSFAQNPHWQSMLPPGNDILHYLYDVCAKFQILDKIQCDTSVKSVRWIADDEEWELVLEHLAPGVGDMSTAERSKVETERGVESAVLRTETIRAKVVASAVGGLVEPKAPVDVPGLDQFEGKVMHTARWDHSLDLKDKEVVVLGTGCSAAQVVPELVKPEHGAKHVTQLLRSPPWSTPFFPPEFTAWWEKWVPTLCTYIPGFQNSLRKLVFSQMELEFVSLFAPTEAARKRRKVKAEELLTHLRKTVPEEYHEIMTPDYEVFCKRRVVDSGWLKSFRDPRIEITSLPLTSVGIREVTLGPGRNYPAMSKTESLAPTEARTIPCDVLVMANGYNTNEWLHPLAVYGTKGQSMADVWRERGGAQAYMGTAMDGFPNFFIIFGPNMATGHSSVILASENMVNYSLKFIEPVLKGDVKTWEVKESAERKWTSDIQKDLKNSVFSSGGCASWYFNKNGWNSTTYPRTQIDYSIRCMFPRWSHWQVAYTRKGLFRLWFVRVMSTVIFTASFVGAVYVLTQGIRRTESKVSTILRSVASRLGLRS